MMSDARASPRSLLRDRRVLAVVVVLLGAILVASVVFTVAAFTATSKNSASVSAGSVVFELSQAGKPLPAGTPVVDTNVLRPGDTRAGDVTITNKNSDASFTLTFTGIAGPLPDVLLLTVDEVPPRAQPLYANKPLSAVPPIPVGPIARGKAMTLRLTFSWPAAQQAPALQGQSVPVVLRWDAST